MANKINYQVDFKVNQTGLKQLKTSLQQLQNMKFSDLMKINNSDISSAREALRGIQQDAEKVESALNKAFNAKLNSVNIQTFNQALDQSGLNIEKVYASFSRAGATGEAAFRNLSTQLLSTNIQLREGHALLDKMAESLAKTAGWHVASSAVNGLTRAVEQAWGYVKSLDTSLNDIRIVTGKSADEMAKFAVQANNAAKELGKTTTDYTNASLIYAQQGLNDQEIAARAAITLKAANVTGQSTDKVSEQLTAVWNGYKVTADEAELYVDRLAAVAATTASDLEELSTGMSKVASAAAAMGVGEDQLAAQLSTIISATKQAPESVGTALRTVYARISDIKAGIDEDGVTLGNYSGKMAELGVNVLDASGHLRDMGEVIEEIGGRWQDLTREQQISLTQTMAGQRQYNNLLALFDHFEQYNEALHTAQNAAGTLQEQQDIYMESTRAHLQVLKASIEDVYDSLIDANAKDGINGLIDGLSEAAVVAANLIDSLGGGQGVLRALGAIGFSVFSDQIARSIQITINNLERARAQTQEFQNAINLAQELQAKNLGNQYTQFVAQNQQSLLKMGGRLSPEQFSTIQSDLAAFSASAGKLEKVNESISLIKTGIAKTQPDLDKLLLKYGNLDAMMSDPQGLEIIIDGLKTLKESLQNTEAAQDKMIKSFQAFGKGETEQAFDDLKNSMTAFLKDFQNFSSSDPNTPFNLLPEGVKKTVEQAKDELSSLTFDTENASDKIKRIFSSLNGALTQQKDTINQLIKSAESGDMQRFDALKAESQRMVDASEGKLKQDFQSSQRTIRLQDITRTVSGIHSMAAAVQQFQNLGSIWKNEDLSTGQKVLQIITNLTFSLPMFIKGLSAAGQAMGLLQVATGKQAATAALAEVANGKQAASILGVEFAYNKGTLAVRAFDTALTMSPIFLAAGAIAGLVAAIGVWVKGVDEAREATIEANKAEIDAINQKQAARQANEELWKSLDELDQKYKNGEISRTELKSSTQELISQYQLEEDQVKSLMTSYDNLSSAIDNMRGKDAEANLQSVRREKRLAENNVVQTMHGTLPFYQRIGNDSQYRFTLDAGNYMGDEPRAFQDALVNAGGKKGPQGQIAFDVEADAKSILELYDSISKAVEDSDQYMTSAQQQNSQYYQTAVKWLETMRESAEAYRAALKDTEAYTTEFAAATKKINFDSIDNVDSYLTQREALIEAVQAQFQEEGIQKTEGELESLVDSYLLANYSQIYNKYAEINDLIQSIEKDAGEVPDSIKKALSGLNQQQLDYISKIAPNIKDWDTFETILEKVSKIDFSNMAVINNDIEALYGQASDTYNKYQSLEQQVKGGKSISPKEFESLDPEIQGFFSRMANGTYKMTADAKTFYNTVNDLKLDGFYKTLGAVNNELEKVSSLRSLVQNSDFDYQSYNKSAVTQRQGTRLFDLQGDTSSPDTVSPPIDYQIVKQQLEYLDAVSQSDEALKANVSTWKDLVQHQSLGVEQAKKIYEAYEQAGDQTENLAESEKILLNDRIALYHQLHDAMFPTDEDVDTGALQALSETISDMAENSTELDQHLTEDARAAQDVAEAILRFDDAVTDVVDNYEDWIKVLNNGSESEKAEIVEGLRDAYADLLDLDGSSLSNEFLTSADNLNLMKAAIDGDIESYDELMSLAGQDIIAHLSLDQEQFNADLTAVQNQLDAMNFQDLEIGASLNTEGFLQACQNLVQNAGMTAQQATDYLASMGVDAEVIEQKATTTETKENTGWHAQPHELPLPYEIPFGNGLSVGFESGAGLITTPTYVPDTQTVVDTKQSSNFALKVISAHKSSGGNFKFTQAPNGGGSKGQARRNTPSKGGKGGGGKKGGSSKAAKPDTSKKDLKKSLEDERDIYHDINIELEQIDRNLDRAQKKQDRLYGKQLLDNLNEQSRILEQHKQTLKEKQKLQEEDLKQQRKTLKNLGVTFDKYGNISNYMSVMGKKQAEVNALIAEENRMIEAYNKQTDADVKKAIAEQIAEQQKKVKAAQDDYKNLQDKIKNYDEAMKGLQDTIDQVTEDAQKQVEINIQKFKMEVEIRLDMGQAERDWNKFRRQVLEHTDIIRNTDFHEIFNDALQNANDVTSYFDVHGSKGSIQMLTEQALRTREQIEQINKTGTSEIYGDNKAQAMEDLQNYLDELMGQMEDVKKLIDDIDKAYLETIDDVEKQFDKQIEDYEFIGELIEHDMDLLSLLYGDKNYDAMNRYYETLEENNLKQLDSLKQQRDFWKQQWDAAMAAGDTQAAKQFEQRYRETIKNLNSLIEDSAKTIQDKYVNAIDKIFDELDKKLTDGKGTDYLNTEWELMNKNADEYLDTINSAFAIQETERKYQQALNDTKNIKNQQALKSLMDEQLDILKNKEKITQYDIDRAEKLLQVEQARIALEDAQSAKTSMRLKRDSQGNYSYEYAADEGAIGDAQANLAAAQNDLYNFDKDAYKKNLDDMLSAYQDFVERSKQLSLAAAQGDAEAQEKLVLLREQFGEYINGKTEQNLTIRTNLTDSALKDLALLYDKNVENYQNMSDGEKKILMEDLIPAWDGGIQKMIDKVAGEGGFIPTIEQSFNKVDKATKDYQQELDGLADAAGISLGDVKDGVDHLADAFGVLVQANDDLVERMEKELTAVQMLREQAQRLVSTYGAVYAAAAQAVTELHNFVQAEQGAAAAYAQTATSYENMIHRIQRANADYVANPLGGSGYTPPSGGGSDSSGSGSGSGGSGSGGSGGSGSGGSGNSSRNGSGNKNTTPKDDVTGRIMGGEYYKKYYGYDTGGYTGNWSSTEGKLAILHQKQQVFNEDDTQKLLEATQILREITSNSDISLRAKMQSFSVKSITSSGNTNTEELQQHVSISASFPNVNSKREIEEAFNDLVNLAAQRAMRRR